MSDEGKILRVLCPRCGTKIAASVIASGPRRGELLSEPSLQSSLCHCPNCGREFLADSYFSLTGLEDLTVAETVSNGEKLKERLGHIACYPFIHVQTPEAIPEKVAVFYSEAVRALASGLPNAAGVMFRKTLEAATVEPAVLADIRSEEKAGYMQLPLARRLSKLKESGVIPPALARLVDTIRLEGNAASHDMETYKSEEAEQLRYFADALLMQVFTIPNKLSSTRTATFMD